MTDEGARLAEFGRDILALFGHAPKAHLKLETHGWIGLSGEVGVADLNMAGIYPDASPAEALGLMQAVEESGVDTILLVPATDSTARDIAELRGHTMVGQVPLMERAAAPLEGHAGSSVARKGTRDEMEEAMALSAPAFSLPLTETVRSMPPALLEDGQRDLWVAMDGSQMIGSGVFVRDGDRVGIYTMATHPDHQRKGAGRAILVEAMRHYQEEGVQRFTLGATDAGYRLYESLGFRDVANPHAAVIGTSTQFPGQG